MAGHIWDGILRVKWPNQQCQSSEGRLVNRGTCVCSYLPSFIVLLCLDCTNLYCLVNRGTCVWMTCLGLLCDCGTCKDGTSDISIGSPMPYLLWHKAIQWQSTEWKKTLTLRGKIIHWPQPFLVHQLTHKGMTAAPLWQHNQIIYYYFF